MKQQDVAMLILIVSIALVLSYFVGNALFGGTENRTAEVERVQVIEPDFPQPDPAIINENAINLTETINIGGSTSTDPFSNE